MHLTAESVAQFMKSVNRIRFNSLTATNTMDIYKQERFKKSRSRSCPSLPKVISVENEDSEGDSDSDQLSRSVSMTSSFKQILQTSQNNQPTTLPVVTTVTTDARTVTTTTSQISITSCPIFSSQDNQSQMQSHNSFMDMMKKSLLPNCIHLCHRCKAYMISDKNQGKILTSYRNSAEPEKLKKSRAGGGLRSDYCVDFGVSSSKFNAYIWICNRSYFKVMG